MSTQAEIGKKGAHLATIREIVGALGLTALSLAPEMLAHCESEAEHVKAFAEAVNDHLRPVLENLDRQLEQLESEYVQAKGEVQDLEQLLQIPDAVKPEDFRPGEGGYL